MLVFDTNIGKATSFQPRLHIPNTGQLEFNEGVVIPKAGNIEEPEVWVCCRSGHGYSILHHEKFCVVHEVSTGEPQEARVVRNMQTMLVNGRSRLAIANRHLVEVWDVKERQKRDDYDTSVHCREFYGDHSKFTVLMLNTCVHAIAITVSCYY